MHPYVSYTAVNVLYEEKLAQAQPDPREQPVRPVTRTLARLLGHTFLALGNQLVHFGA